MLNSRFLDKMSLQPGLSLLLIVQRGKREIEETKKKEKKSKNHKVKILKIICQPTMQGDGRERRGRKRGLALEKIPGIWPYQSALARAS